DELYSIHTDPALQARSAKVGGQVFRQIASEPISTRTLLRMLRQSRASLVSHRRATWKQGRRLCLDSRNPWQSSDDSPSAFAELSVACQALRPSKNWAHQVQPLSSRLFLPE